jgi:hypothetical protein
LCETSPEQQPGSLRVRSDIKHITVRSVTAGLSRSLRRLLGPGRRWSYAAVSKGTGIDIRTLKAYVQGTACPNLVRYKRLLAILGPEVGEDLNRLQGMLPRRDGSPPEALDLVTLRAELVRATTILHSVLGTEPSISSPRLPNAIPPREAEAAVPTRPEFRQPVKPLKIDMVAVVERLSFRLREMIGPGRRWSHTEVADATGIDIRTLRSYCEGTACPNLTRYMRLMQCLGPESGYELALMLGWQPRFRAPSDLSRASLEALAQAAETTRVALDELMSGSGGRRLISPQDRLREAPEDIEFPNLPATRAGPPRLPH